VSALEEKTQTAAEETAPARSRNGATGRAADWSWEVIRRIHLGTRKPANWAQLVKFGLVGASGYVINLVAFAALAGPADLHHISAAVLAFCVAVTNNFLWNRHWTFEATERHPAHQGARFLAVSLVALGFNLIVLELLVSVAGLGELPSQAVAVAVAMPLNFVGNKLWTFG
jgi:putative flippase GtrA